MSRIIIVGVALIVAEVLGVVAYYRREAYIERQVELLRSEDVQAAEEARRRLQRMGRPAVKSVTSTARPGRLPRSLPKRGRL
ncbi:MAG: hypothetical protein ACE5R4_13875, partial [Armatimonadota bacterium]